jgi:hypothetical protein
MNIAMMNIYSEPYGDRRTGGLITAPMHLANGTVPVAFGKLKKSHVPGWKYVTSFDQLNDYDFIIFSSAGSNNDKKDPWWFDELPKIKIPFAVQCYSELDEKMMLYKDRFFEHPMFRLFLPIAENMWHVMPDIPTHIYPCLQSEIKVREFDKESIVASTCRLTSTKRIGEFVSMAARFSDIGFRTQVWGAESSYFYTKAIKEINPGHWEYKGLFTPDDLDDVMGPVAYHWNCRSFRVRCKFSPRFEIATVEALERGCIPIVEHASTLKEYHDHLITVDTRGDMSEMIEKVEAGFGDVAKCVKIFNRQHRHKEGELLDAIARCI